MAKKKSRKKKQKEDKVGELDESVYFVNVKIIIIFVININYTGIYTKLLKYPKNCLLCRNMHYYKKKNLQNKVNLDKKLITKLLGIICYALARHLNDHFI